MQCWTDIDTSGAQYVNQANGNLSWEEKTAIFTATSANTWIQILGSDANEILYIDDITMVSCS